MSLSHQVLVVTLDWCDPSVWRLTQSLQKSGNLSLTFCCCQFWQPCCWHCNALEQNKIHVVDDSCWCCFFDTFSRGQGHGGKKVIRPIYSSFQNILFYKKNWHHLLPQGGHGFVKVVTCMSCPLPNKSLMKLLLRTNAVECLWSVVPLALQCFRF